MNKNDKVGHAFLFRCSYQQQASAQMASGETASIKEVGQKGKAVAYGTPAISVFSKKNSKITNQRGDGRDAF